MTKKSNKNSTKVNREKKLSNKRSKSVLSGKSSNKKQPGMKDDAHVSAGGWNPKPTAAELLGRNATKITRPTTVEKSKVTPTPPDPVYKILQPANVCLSKQKSNTNMKAANNVAVGGTPCKTHNIPNPLVPQTVTANAEKPLNVAKAKSDAIQHHALVKPHCMLQEENKKFKDTTNFVVTPIAFAKPYPYPLEPSFNYQLYKEFKQVADVAMRFRKTFMVYGAFPAVRRSLKNRGWVEKFPFNAHEALMKLTINELLKKLENNETQKDLCETVIITKMLGARKPDFIWNNSTHAKDAHTFDACQILSRMRHEPQGNFTQKYGLNRCLQDTIWHYIPGEAEIKFPRCYNTAIKDQMVIFEEDFLLTACVSLLAYLQTKTCKELISETGKIGYDTIEFAIAHCNRYIYKMRHLDIDDPVYEDDEDPKDKISKEDINDFLYCYYQIVQHEKTFELDESNVLEGLKSESLKIYNSIKHMFPQHFIDGYCNMWLIKPGNQSRGRGILVLQKLDDIQDEIKKAPRKYVIQKYIERPLLIYGTKFDIRQYFLLTGTCPLTIWMYQDCYLRFSSRIYDLKDFHQAIHLTNNAIQSHYKNEEARDSNLPRDNMWHSSTFQQYLSDHGCPNAWNKLIYPGMRRCIVGTLLASQEFLDRRSNSFELYGCDFLISEDFTPWLIEINSGPAMSPSTSVTAKLCPQALEDVIKVVVDYTRNWRAPTGRFELIYRQYLPSPDVLPQREEFLIEGKSLPDKYFHNFTYNEMLKVPSFSHLLRNQPRKEVNEYNELLPYVKEKMLRDKNLYLDSSLNQSDKKTTSQKRKRVRPNKESEKKMAYKRLSTDENFQGLPKAVELNKVLTDTSDSSSSSEKDSPTIKKNVQEVPAKTFTAKKFKTVQKSKREYTESRIITNDTRTSSNIDLRETNAKEDLKTTLGSLIKFTPAPVSESSDNSSDSSRREIRIKKRKIVKIEPLDQLEAKVTEGKNYENSADNSAIDDRKQQTDAAVSNNPIAMVNKTISSETSDPQQKTEKRVQRTIRGTSRRGEQKTSNLIKIPPTIKALKSLQ